MPPGETILTGRNQNPSAVKVTSPTDIRPLPKAGRALDDKLRLKTNKKKGKSMILTSSPVYKSLIDDKKEKPKRKAMVSKGKKTCRKRRKSLFEKPEASSEEDNDEMTEK